LARFLWNFRSEIPPEFARNFGEKTTISGNFAVFFTWRKFHGKINIISAVLLLPFPVGNFSAEIPREYFLHRNFAAIIILEEFRAIFRRNSTEILEFPLNFCHARDDIEGAREYDEFITLYPRKSAKGAHSAFTPSSIAPLAGHIGTPFFPFFTDFPLYMGLAVACNSASRGYSKVPGRRGAEVTRDFFSRIGLILD
jgi:hypothetical protein